MLPTLHFHILVAKDFDVVILILEISKNKRELILA